MVVGGPAAVRMTFTWPFDSATVNECESLPPTGTVPENISVVGGVEGPVTVVLSELLLHAAAINTAATAGRSAALRRSPIVIMH
jgi:hypothetical protein